MRPRFSRLAWSILVLFSPAIAAQADMAPTITQNPADTSVSAGMAVNLIVTATGTAPLTYQWYHDGMAVGPNAASYLLVQVSPDMSGSYTAAVSNSAGTAISSPARVIVSPAPVINKVESTTHIGGVDSATLTTYAYGKSPLTFHWTGPRTDVTTEATGFNPASGYYSTLKISPLTAADVGRYRIEVSNSVGSTINDIVVTLGEPPNPPLITAGVTRHVAVLGQAVTLGISTVGAAPITYQWFLNGAAINGATNSTYTIPAMELSNIGTYLVTATNPFGTDTSAPGVLSFLPNLPYLQTAFTGNRVAIAPSAFPSGTAIQWQISTDDGATWNNLVDGPSYAGTRSATLVIQAVTDEMLGNLYRFDSTAEDTTATSNSLILDVRPRLLTMPVGIAMDSMGGLRVTDAAAQIVLQVGPDHKLRLLAGNKGEMGSRDGINTMARFNEPSGIVLRPDGSMLIADTGNATIRQIETDGTVTTLAGSAGMTGASGGFGTAARFAAPIGITRASNGNYYVSDQTNQVIRILTPTGITGTVAGMVGITGSVDSIGLSALFNFPTGLTADQAGNVYVADQGNHVIRKIAPDGRVTTVAGVTGQNGSADGIATAASFNHPRGLAVDAAGNVYVADTGNSSIRKVSGGMVTTLAGSVSSVGLKDGAGSGAWFNAPEGITISSNGTLFVADTGNAAIRSITPYGKVTTLPLTVDGPVISSQPVSVTTNTGTRVTFAVTATSAIPATYQWKKNSSELPGATTATFIIPSVSAADSGSYNVVVRNAFGTVTSDSATLSIDAPYQSGTTTGSNGGGGAPSIYIYLILGLLVGIELLRRGPALL